MLAVYLIGRGSVRRRTCFSLQSAVSRQSGSHHDHLPHGYGHIHYFVEDFPARKTAEKRLVRLCTFGGRRRALCSGKIKVCSDEVDRMNVVVFVQKKRSADYYRALLFSLLLIDIAAILVA